ncbi:MAG: 23S rRNA (pseudouridine(1915)-N(3))-methyltransferase RlmH [Planctomycetota bacterium]
MRLIVVQHGRVRDKHVLALREDYRKRFRKYGSLDVIEAMPKRGQGIWPAKADWRVLVDERGHAYRSEELAAQLQQWSMHQGTIAIAIGEAYGHDDATRAEADAQWSLGPLILPHQLAHLVVVEQLYRAASMLAGSPYHHA